MPSQKETAGKEITLKVTICIFRWKSVRSIVSFRGEKEENVTKLHTKRLCAWHFFPIFVPTEVRTAGTMRKRLHIIILSWLCLLTQAVSACPHHHHAQALCLGQEMEPACPVEDTHACTSGCITHFQLVSPSSGTCLSCKKAARQSCMLRAANDLSAIHVSRVSRKPCDAYRPVAYLSRPAGGKSMRAPPRG